MYVYTYTYIYIYIYIYMFLSPSLPTPRQICVHQCATFICFARGNGCMFAANDSQPVKTLPPETYLYTYNNINITYN